MEYLIIWRIDGKTFEQAAIYANDAEACEHAPLGRTKASWLRVTCGRRVVLEI